MNKLLKLIFIGIIGINIILPQITTAQRGNGQFGNCGKNCWRKGFIRSGWLLQKEMDSLRFEVIAEITEQPLDTIKEDLKNKPAWAVLDSYDVKFTDFQSQMYEQTVLFINNAAEIGKITQGQKKKFLERMNQGFDTNRLGRRQRNKGGLDRGFGGNCGRN